MADLESLEKIWRQSWELNLRYYTTVGRLTVDYFKDLMAALTPLQPAAPRSSARSSAPVPPSPASTAAPAQAAGVMVLESEAGGQALGVFLVANNLGYDIAARVTTSTFIDANGRAVQPTFTFDPDTIMLASGEQILVRVATVIDETLEPEVRYRGEFTIPELAGTRIPIVLRRRPDPSKPSIEADTMAADRLDPAGSSDQNRSAQAP